MTGIKSEIRHYPGTQEAFFTKSEYTHHHFQPHFHTHYVFFGVMQGINEGSFSRKKYSVSSSDLLIIHPGQIHSGNSYSNRSLKYGTFCPTEKFLMATLEGMEFNAVPYFPPVMTGAGDLVQCFRALFNNDHCMIEQSLIEFLGKLIERTCGDQRNSSKVYKEKIIQAKKFIEENYTDDISLSALSLHTGLSTYHLLRSFKACVGITPRAYLYNFRAEMAKMKIGQKISLTQLAHHSGFYDQSHFIRHFKKINGIAPSRFK